MTEEHGLPEAGGNPHVDCEDIHVFLYQFVDKAMTAEEQKRLEAHLDLCPGCAEVVANETQLRGVLQKVCESAAPSSLCDRILKALKLS